MALLQSTDKASHTGLRNACLPGVTNLSDYKEFGGRGGRGGNPGTQLVSGHDPFWPDVPDAAHSRSDPCCTRSGAVNAFSPQAIGAISPSVNLAGAGWWLQAKAYKLY
ncbi:hypothetical protein TRIATDRAFT_313798 [Trichoderma atroviride IMI 206040]|uniref:Uncharacterized protein n=1 Tax=Hypocrea atroviridis (strain ATCC 20476 / IMI 206040) TaxID=452589 RepID=G9PBM9_HYPAI|nr:uncharacterized protein TRIATDRAFT_313798 [Trichoderma atroviride IMI 206040]EHK39773.1 hypothetical protein TRIATDRAFT_313798 [Trichoderma atroviride IMI 206040]